MYIFKVNQDFKPFFLMWALTNPFGAFSLHLQEISCTPKIYAYALI